MNGLYRYYDALNFPAVDAGQLVLSSLPACVFLESSRKRRIFKRCAPIFHDDPDDEGLFSGGFAEDEITYPPAFVAAARNALVVGHRSVLTEDGFFFNDDSRRGPQRHQFLAEFSRPDPYNEETGLRPSGALNRFALHRGDRSIQRIEGTTILLTSQEPSNYGSWLFRVLPKLHAAQRIALPSPPRYLVWAGVPAFREYLKAFGIMEHQIVHHDPNTIYHLDRLIVPSMRNNQAFLDPETLELFARVRDKMGCPAQTGRKIYVSRLFQSQNSSRMLLNEKELIIRLLELGFCIVAPEHLSIPEQILAFSSAEMVVGPSGSGMFNVVFCHPGTKIVDIESEPHWIHAHRNLFASCGSRYGIFVGSTLDRDFREHHKPWTVNIEALVSRVVALSQIE